MNHWLVKSEPGAYSWKDFVKEGRSAWTGVRNFQARNNLRAMKKGDLVCFYHSGGEKQVVGVARVTREAWADPTTDEDDWVCVELAAIKPLPQPVTLHVIKSDPAFREILLVRNSRLSVTPLTAPQFDRILQLGKSDKESA